MTSPLSSAAIQLARIVISEETMTLHSLQRLQGQLDQDLRSHGLSRGEHVLTPDGPGTVLETAFALGTVVFSVQLHDPDALPGTNGTRHYTLEQLKPDLTAPVLTNLRGVPTRAALSAHLQELTAALKLSLQLHWERGGLPEPLERHIDGLLVGSRALQEGHAVPLRPRASCVLRQGDNVLLMIRTKGARQYAALPGGGVDPGETPAEAAAREVNEETGLLIQNVSPAGILSHPGRVEFVFTADHQGQATLSGDEAQGNPQGSGGTYELRWMTPEQARADGLLSDHLWDILSRPVTPASQ